MPDETNEIDWAAREEELLALKKDDLMAAAAEADLDTSGNKADIAARIIAAEQDALAVEPEGDASDATESSEETTSSDINVDADAVVDVTDDADDESDEAEAEAEDEEDMAVGDAMADVAAEESADRAADLAADEAEAVKAAADHEVAHSMAVPATPGTVVTLDPDRIVQPTKPAEAWDALQKSIQADLQEQAGPLFKDASEAAKFVGEFSQKLAKYKYKAATARDTFQKRQYEQNIKHLEAQAATEAARIKQKLVKSGDAMLESILKITIKAVSGAALGALL